MLPILRDTFQTHAGGNGPCLSMVFAGRSSDAVLSPAKLSATEETDVSRRLGSVLYMAVRACSNNCSRRSLSGVVAPGVLTEAGEAAVREALADREGLTDEVDAVDFEGFVGLVERDDAGFG